MYKMLDLFLALLTSGSKDRHNILTHTVGGDAQESQETPHRRPEIFFSQDQPPEERGGGIRILSKNFCPKKLVPNRCPMTSRRV